MNAISSERWCTLTPTYARECYQPPWVLFILSSWVVCASISLLPYIIMADIYCSVTSYWLHSNHISTTYECHAVPAYVSSQVVRVASGDAMNGDAACWHLLLYHYSILVYVIALLKHVTLSGWVSVPPLLLFVCMCVPGVGRWWPWWCVMMWWCSTELVVVTLLTWWGSWPCEFFEHC